MGMNYSSATRDERRDVNGPWKQVMTITLHPQERALLKRAGVRADLTAPRSREDWMLIADDVYCLADDLSPTMEERAKDIASVIDALADRGLDQPFRSLPGWARPTGVKRAPRVKAADYRPSPNERGSAAKAGGDATGIGYVFDDAGQAADDAEGRGICVQRALAIATGTPLSEVIETTRRLAREAGVEWSPTRGGTQVRLADRLYDHYGMERQAMPARKPTLAEAHAEYGDCICHIAHHRTACVGGANRDTWDCRLTWGGRNYRVKAVWTRRAS